jgi:hypothetical protein
MWTVFMDIASAYPNSALPAGALVILAVVMVAGLALWIILVFRADQSSASDSGRAKRHLGVAGSPGAAEDRHSDAGRVPAGRRRGGAA